MNAPEVPNAVCALPEPASMAAYLHLRAWRSPIRTFTTLFVYLYGHTHSGGGRNPVFSMQLTPAYRDNKFLGASLRWLDNGYMRGISSIELVNP